MRVIYQETPPRPFRLQHFRRFVTEADNADSRIPADVCFINVSVSRNDDGTCHLTGSAAFVSSDGTVFYIICGLDGDISPPSTSEGGDALKRSFSCHVGFSIDSQQSHSGVSEPLFGMVYAIAGELVGDRADFERVGRPFVFNDAGPIPRPQLLPDRSIVALQSVQLVLSLMMRP